MKLLLTAALYPFLSLFLLYSPALSSSALTSSLFFSLSLYLSLSTSGFLIAGRIIAHAQFLIGRRASTMEEIAAWRISSTSRKFNRER